MRIFSGIQPTGEKHLGNLIGGFRQYAATQEQGDRVLLHRRPPLDHDRLRPGRPPRAHARPLRDAHRDRARPRAVDGVRPEPRDGARRGGLAAVGCRELRPVGPHDAVQGEGRPQGLRLRGALHLPGADGGRHPALPGRHRPDRRRPAPAPRARARRGGALQHPLRRHVHRAAGRLPGGRGPDHGPAGADAEDVDDGRHAAGHDRAARPSRRGAEEVPLRRDRLGPRGAARGRQAGRVEPDRHPLGRIGPDAGGDRGAATETAATASSSRTSARPSSSCSRRCRSGTPSSGPTRASCCGCWRSAPTRRGPPRARRSRGCTRRWASCGCEEDGHHRGGGLRARRRGRRPPLHRRAAGRGLRSLGGRARRRRVGDRDRDRVGRGEVRPRRDRRAPVDARQPARALHRDLLAQRRRARRGAVLDPRLAVRERAARARARDRRRRDARPRTA